MTASSIELGFIRVPPFCTGRTEAALEQLPTRLSPPSGGKKPKVNRNLFGKPKPNETVELFYEEQNKVLKRFRQRYKIIERIEAKLDVETAEAAQCQQSEDNSELELPSELIERKELRSEQDEGDEVQEEKCNLNSAMMSCAAAEITPPPYQNKKRRMAAAEAESESATEECSDSCGNYCDNGVDAGKVDVKSFAVVSTKQSLITDSFKQRKNNPANKPLGSSLTDVVSSSTSSPLFSTSNTNNDTDTFSIPPTVAAGNRSQKEQHHDLHKVLLPKLKRTVNAADTSTSTYPRICDSALCDTTTTTTTTTSQQNDMLVLSLQITTAEMPQMQEAQQSSSSSSSSL